MKKKIIFFTVLTFFLIVSVSGAQRAGTMREERDSILNRLSAIEATLNGSGTMVNTDTRLVFAKVDGLLGSFRVKWSGNPAGKVTYSVLKNRRDKIFRIYNQASKKVGEILSLCGRIRDLEETITYLTQRMQESDSEIQNLRNELYAKEKEAGNLKKENQRLQARLENYKKKLDNVYEQARDLLGYIFNEISATNTSDKNIINRFTAGIESIKNTFVGYHRIFNDLSEEEINTKEKRENWLSRYRIESEAYGKILKLWSDSRDRIVGLFQKNEDIANISRIDEAISRISNLLPKLEARKEILIKRQKQEKLTALIILAVLVLAAAAACLVIRNLSRKRTGSRKMPG